MIMQVVRTVSAGLHRSFDISNTLDCHSVLIVTVHELIFELANFIYQNPELVGHIRNIVVT
jgi:hypothetical protein